jgi:hypothetical protein
LFNYDPSAREVEVQSLLKTYFPDF